MSPSSREMHIANYHNLGLSNPVLFAALKHGSYSDVMEYLIRKLSRSDTKHLLAMTRTMASYSG